MLEKFSIKTTELELEEIFKLIDFWFKTNPQVFVVFESEDDGSKQVPGQILGMA